jgi:hypothetical protein
MARLLIACWLTGLVLLGSPQAIRAQLGEKLGLAAPAPRLSSFGGYYGYFPTSWRPWPGNAATTTGPVSITGPVISGYTTPGSPIGPATGSRIVPSTHSNAAVDGLVYPIKTVPSVPVSPGSAMTGTPPLVPAAPVTAPGFPASSAIRVREPHDLASDSVELPAVPGEAFTAPSVKPLPLHQPTATPPIASPRRILRIHLPDDSHEPR